MVIVETVQQLQTQLCVVRFRHGLFVGCLYLWYAVFKVAAFRYHVQVTLQVKEPSHREVPCLERWERVEFRRQIANRCDTF